MRAYGIRITLDIDVYIYIGYNQTESPLECTSSSSGIARKCHRVKLEKSVFGRYLVRQFKGSMIIIM